MGLSPTTQDNHFLILVMHSISSFFFLIPGRVETPLLGNEVMSPSLSLGPRSITQPLAEGGIRCKWLWLGVLSAEPLLRRGGDLKRLYRSPCRSQEQCFHHSSTRF